MWIVGVLDELKPFKAEIRDIKVNYDVSIGNFFEIV